MEKFTLGLDIGANSIGWAIVNNEPKMNEQNIIAHTHVFPAGTDNEGKSEKSRNAKRREARQRRRQSDRRSRRKRKLHHILAKHGIKALMHTRYQKTGDKDALPNPYALRKKALDEKITLPELGRVLNHLNQRRGYKSNAKTDDPKESKVLFEGNADTKKEGKRVVNTLREGMEETNSRTLGEYFAGLNPHESRIRNTYTLREMYEHEFNMIMDKQEEYYPEVLKPARDDIYHAIFDQRPLKPMDHKIGACALEPDEKRCPRASWLAHRFRILQTLNDFRLIIHSDKKSHNRKLTDEERKWALEKLHNQQTLSISSFRKHLKLDDKDEINFESEGFKSIEGNPIQAAISKKQAKGKPDLFEDWRKDPERLYLLCTEIYDQLIDLDPDEFRKLAKEKWGISEEQVNALFQIKCSDGYMAYSRKALKNLIPKMEKGLDRYEAIEECGYSDPEIEKMEFLPPVPEDITNPVVRRCISEARKIVNAIIKEYGRPEKIVVEMARETKGSIKQRQEYQKKINKQRDERENIANKLRKNNIRPTRTNIIKWQLWKECDHGNPYDDNTISLEQLFVTGEYQIEHIFPRERSHDNGYMNLTLCHVDINREKGNKTPYEAWGETDKHEEIMNRIRDMKKMPFPKKKRFAMKELPEDWSERQLRDTSYAAKATAQFLKHLDCKVQTTRGSVVGELRHQWGLNSIIPEIQIEEGIILDDGENDLSDIEKDRSDQRHHAVDAIAIALSNHSIHQQLSSSYREQRIRALRRDFGLVSIPTPWEDKNIDQDAFRDQVRKAIASINVSYRPNHKLSGQLYKDTNYGRNEKSGKFVHRVKVIDLTDAQVKKDKIVDKVVRETVKKTFRKIKEENMNNEEKLSLLSNLRMPTKNGKPGPLIKKVRIHDTKKVVFPVNDNKQIEYRYMESAGNHHISIYEYKDENGNTKRCKDFVSLAEAVRRKQNKEPVVRKTHPEYPQATFMFSLCKNDMVHMKDDSGKERLYRLQKITDSESQEGIISYFRLHTDAHMDKEINELPDEAQKIIKPCRSTLNADSFKVSKVTVDMLGRVRRAND